MGQAGTLAILVAYKNTSGLEGALRSLDGWCEALVVDNGVDTAARAVAEAYGARYMTPGQNVGFAAAVNRGLQERGERNVLLLNPDARVSEHVLSALDQALVADSRLAAVAPRLKGEDGAPQRVEWPVPSPREEWRKAFRLERLVTPAWTFLIGAVLLLRGDAIEEVGEFDERFFLYAEECDWQLRAQRRGWRVTALQDVVATHIGGGSSDVESLRQQLFHQSAELFALKWHGKRGWMSMQTASRIGTTLRLILTLPNRERRKRYARQLRL